MKVLLIIGGVILFFYLLDKFHDYRDRRREEQLAKQIGPKLDELLDRITSVDTVEISSELNGLKYKFTNQLAILKDENNTVLNLCPKCGDTLKVKNTGYYGKIFGCPNYPKCRHLKKVADLEPDTFDSLKVE